MSGQLWWYVARAGGIVAWALLAGSVLWGLALSTKALGGRPRPNWLLDLHRFLGGLALVFTGIHVAALVLDNYIDFGLTQILVPFTSSYRPTAVAWGVVALQLLVAVEVTSLLRRSISRRTWRLVHFASFPLYASATVHGLTAGTDSGNRILVLAMWLSVAAVAGLTVLRVAQVDTPAASSPSRSIRSELTRVP